MLDLNTFINGYNDSYYIKSILYKNNQSIIYYGISKYSNKEFIIKEILYNNKQIQQEIECLQIIKDIKGVIKYIENININKKTIIITKYIKGITMREYEYKLKQENILFPITLLYNIIIKVLNILNEIHKKHIIHFDIKPENIILSGNPLLYDTINVYIIDFGISRYKNNDYYFDNRDAPGTVYYMSPEALRGRIYADYLSDIYSIGKIIYEYILPYNNNNIVIDNNPFSNDFINKILHNDKDKRYQNIQEILHVLTN